MLDIKITRTSTPKAKPEDESKLGFGKIFTDHMFVMDYTAGQGWHDARIVPYGPFQLDPATVVLHYAQEIFEGMKAYRTADGTVQLFRPDCNAKRMQDSADRLCIPAIPEEDYIQAVEAIVDVDRDWVPHTFGASLYIRPFAFATDVGLGVHASRHYTFCIICSPSGAYYAEGIDPVRIYVEDDYIRAAPGLTGFTKCGGNYAASIKAGELAEEQGYAQVLWLDGVEKKYVEEVGSMNIMFKIDGKVYTAATVGTVLPGVTRRSCIELLKDRYAVGPPARHQGLDRPGQTGLLSLCTAILTPAPHKGGSFLVAKVFTSLLYCDKLTEADRPLGRAGRELDYGQKMERPLSCGGRTGGAGRISLPACGV